MATATDHIRNVVLVGHNGNGKTSLAEALLYRAGVINRPGRVDDGNTVTDSDPIERDRKQSVSLSTARFAWKDKEINLIDTPGYADFTGQAIMGLHVAELAVFVIDAVAGVQSQDIILWRHADRLGLPRLIFINKLDRDHSSFERTLDQVRDVFGTHADPIELPLGEESSFHGVADVLTHEVFLYDNGAAEPGELPANLVDAEQTEHEHLVEEVVELDDELLEKYLDGTEPDLGQLERLLHDAVDAARVFPVLCGSATAPIGTDHLMDFICNVGPAPGDTGPAEIEAGGESREIAPDPGGPPLAFVFKTTTDEFLGQLSLFKVLSGTIRTDDTLVNSRTGNKERLHQIISLSGSSHSSLTEVGAGEIAAVAKLNDTLTGDTLAPEGMPARVAALPLPKPVYGIAVKATNQSHEDKLATALRRIVLEDPTLSVRHDGATHQTVLSGGGETQIQVALARIAASGVEVDTEDVRVAYMETIAGPIEVEGKYKKQTGGHGQFGVATVEFEPLPRGQGFEFESKVTGGAIPRNLIPAVSAGIEEAMQRGGKYGFPVIDVKATCLDGKYHAVDSSEMSFKMAGSLAFREAIEAAGVHVLEPVSEIWVHVPNEHQGDVMGDLNSRRAQIIGTEASDGTMTTIHARVPTSEVVRYAIDLRSMTGGTGTFEIEHVDYQEMPAAHLARLAEAPA